MPLRIDFVEPKRFGFSENLMEENNIPLIICGHVATYKGLVKHTGMAEHCCVEYRNLAEILSKLYLHRQ